MKVATNRVRTKRASRRLRKRTLWLTALPTLGLCLVLAAVMIRAHNTRDPNGQVVARVGGEEITRQDVMAEARAQDRPPSAPLTPELVQTVVDRKLLAQEARRRGVQHAPTFPSDQRRAQAQLLASALLRSLPPVATPSPAQVDAFVAAHPELFADRKRLVLDEMRYRTGGAPELQGLSFEDARARLEAGGIRYAAFQVTTFASDLPAALQHALGATSDRQMVVWRDGDTSTAMHVALIDPAPLIGAPAQLAAYALMVRAERERQVSELTGHLKAQGVVKIQPVYGG